MPAARAEVLKNVEYVAVRESLDEIEGLLRNLWMVATKMLGANVVRM